MKGHDTRELRIGERILDRRSVCNLRGGKGVHILRGELWRYGLHNDQCSPPSTRDRWLERGTMLEGWTLLVAWLLIQCFTMYMSTYVKETVT